MFDTEKVLSELTLEEKTSLISGLYFWTTKPIERLGIPAITMTDGPHGLRKEFGADSGKGGLNIMKGSEPATCFPPAVTMASSWDTDLIKQIGVAIAEEAHDQNISTILGPGINIKRSPLCGRNFEYYSEDPFLTGTMATSFVEGVQSCGIGTSLKHFACNNQEYNRMSIDSVIDERALREIYLSAFEKVVKTAKPQQIMASYNRIDGVYVSENKRFLTDILRTEWGYRGLVVSDWGAVSDRVEGIKAGLDLQMPGTKGVHDKLVLNAVLEGRLSEADLDKAVLNVLNYVNECADKRIPNYKADYDMHHMLCKQMGTHSAVLLKNEGQALPLKETDDVIIIGKLAENCRYQGSGSSRIASRKPVSIIDALKQNGRDVEYAEGYLLTGDGYSKKLVKDAVDRAHNKQKIVAVVGLTDVYESEGFDRTHINIPEGQVKLLDELSVLDGELIIVLQCGSPVVIPAREKAKAILNTYLLGEAVGEATYELLYGVVNPSGKLAETFPESLDDCISNKYFPMGPRTVEYRESIYVGYRYFDTAHKKPAYPFGHGLSYTEFEYSNAKSNSTFNKGDTLTVTVDIKNTGEYDGEEVVQLYVRHYNSPIFKANKELKAFHKVFVPKGETVPVEMTLDDRSFAYYNTAANDWSILSGDYELLIGSSSRDIRITLPVVVLGDDLPIPDTSELDAYRKIASVDDIPTEQFEKLLGKKVPDNLPCKKGEFTMNTTIGEASFTGLGKFILGITKIASKFMASESLNAEMIVHSVECMPLRGLCGFSGGILSMYSISGLVDMFNGVKGGFKKFVNGFKKKNK